MTTIDFLDAIRRRYDCSDYRAAKMLGIGRGTASSYRCGRSMMSEAVAIRAAELLDLDPAYVLAEIAAERTPVAEARAVWHKAAQRLAKMSAAALIAIAIGIGSFAANSKAYALQAHGLSHPGATHNNVYYVIKAMIRIAAMIRSLFARLHGTAAGGGVASRSIAAA